MEISLVFQGKTSYLTAPESPYKDNFEEFAKLLAKALAGIDMEITAEGALTRLDDTEPISNANTA